MRLPTETPASAAMQRRVDDAAGPAVHHLQGVERHPGGELDVPEARQVLDPGEVGQPGQPGRVEVPLELVERLLLGPAPLVGGAQVVDGQLGQADPQGRGPGQRPVGVHPERAAGPRVAAQGGAVLAVRVDDEQPVAAVGPHDPARQDLHEVGLAHAGGGEDADVAGQAGAGNADGEVDDGLAAAQLSRPGGRPCARPGRRSPPASGPPPPRTGWAGSWVCGTMRSPAPTSGGARYPRQRQSATR